MLFKDTKDRPYNINIHIFMTKNYFNEAINKNINENIDENIDKNID
jgi:hypothetical protein